MDKRYLIFGYDKYYPGGGLEDLQYSCDTINEAVEIIKTIKNDYVEIYDRVEGREILKGVDY